MKGKYKIEVQNKRIRYEFFICRNLTIIKGDSATGKTTLVDMIREFYENGVSSGVKLRSEKECVVLEGKNWKHDLEMIRDSIVFIDEGNEFVFSDQFASTIRGTDNYYVIVTREGIPSLPYSVEEIYGIRNSGKYGTLKQTYNEFYHLYGKRQKIEDVEPEIVITEDSNSGFQFFEGLSEKGAFSCQSAGGKSNIFSELVKYLKEEPQKDVIVFADGAAFGPEMERITMLAEKNKHVILYLPESFEWLILKAGMIGGKTIQDILEHPEQYIQSEIFFSWERYFTSVLVEKTKETYFRYAKKQLNPIYLQEPYRKKIIEEIGWLES